jgi:hypothetical protein
VILLHAGYVADEPCTREHALRRLPLPYSLALRLRDAGVALEMVGEYLGVEEAALEGIFRIAEAKFVAAQDWARDEFDDSGATGDAPGANDGHGSGDSAGSGSVH